MNGYAKEDLKTRIPCGNNMAKVHILLTIKSDSVRQQPEHERIPLPAIPTDDAIHSSASADVDDRREIIPRCWPWHKALHLLQPFTYQVRLMRTGMYRDHLVALCGLSYIVAHVFSANLYPKHGAPNASLVLPTFVNNTGLNINPRPVLPYHVQVTGSDTSIQFTQYFALTDADRFYPCIIQALVQIYEAAIYDRGDRPLRGDTYVLQRYDIIIDVHKMPGAPRNSLKYAAVVKMLLAVELFTHEYGTYGLSLVIYEEQEAVGIAIVRQFTGDGAGEQSEML